MRTASGMRCVMLASCAALLAGAAYAAQPGKAPASAEGWHLEITPYVWFANIDGSVSVRDKTADFDADFSDLLDKVDLAGELMAVASYNRWVGFAQADFFSLNQDFSKGPGGELNSDMLMLTGTAGYRFDGFLENATVDVLAGVRWLRNKSKVDVNGLGSSSDTSDLVDAIAMLRPSFPLTFVSNKLWFNPVLSIGAGGSDLVWEVQPELLYQFTDRFAGRVGYRRIQYDYSDGPADVDVGFQGFLVGLGVTL